MYLSWMIQHRVGACLRRSPVCARFSNLCPLQVFLLVASSARKYINKNQHLFDEMNINDSQYSRLHWMLSVACFWALHYDSVACIWALHYDSHFDSNYLYNVWSLDIYGNIVEWAELHWCLQSARVNLILECTMTHSHVVVGRHATTVSTSIKYSQSTSLMRLWKPPILQREQLYHVSAARV